MYFLRNFSGDSELENINSALLFNYCFNSYDFFKKKEKRKASNVNIF